MNTNTASTQQPRNRSAGMRSRPARTRRRLTAAFTLLGLAASVLLAAASTPAAAAVPPTLVTVKGQAPGGTSPAISKTAVATCPRGTRIYHGSGDIVGGAHAVALTGLVPAISATGDTMTVTAERIDRTFTGAWSLYAYVTCGPDHGQVIVPGFQNPGPTSPIAETAQPCPSGMFATFTGGRVNNGAGNVVLTEGSIFGNGTIAQELVAIAGQVWSLSGYTVCAPAVHTTLLNGSGIGQGETTAHVECPPGGEVYGYGYTANSNSASDGHVDVHLDRVAYDGPAADGSFGVDLDLRDNQRPAGGTVWAGLEVLCVA
jgi:hypothetical protein